MIHVGIIGLGFGKNVHLPAFRLDPRCQVSSICSTRLDAAKEASEQFGIPHFSDRWQDLIHDPSLDAIAISTPPLVQAQILAEVINAGKHLFCEKPLGT